MKKTAIIFFLGISVLFGCRSEEEWVIPGDSPWVGRWEWMGSAKLPQEDLLIVEPSSGRRFYFEVLAPSGPWKPARISMWQNDQLVLVFDAVKSEELASGGIRFVNDRQEVVELFRTDNFPENSFPEGAVLLSTVYPFEVPSGAQPMWNYFERQSP